MGYYRPVTSTPARQLSLAHLTVLDTTPPELVTVAAAAGFRTVGIRLTATPRVGVPPYDCLRDGPMLRETLARLADTGVFVLDTEFLRFEPDQPVGVPDGFLDVSARLGARHVLVMSAEPEEARTLERFGDLLAHKLFECHAGDASDQLANQVGEGEHVEAVSGGRHGARQARRVVALSQSYRSSNVDGASPARHAGGVGEDVANFDALLDV